MGNGRPPHAEYLSAALAKRAFNQAMKLKELAAAYGIAYGKMRRMSLEPGFPIVLGVVVPGDFDRWRAEAAGRRPQTGANPLPRAGRTSRELALNRGLTAAWPHLLAHLPGADSTRA